jgi:SAM-dependent methyltransferase
MEPGARILDCPCGYGRHTVELARRGYDVVGIDLCAQFVAEARRSASLLPATTRWQILEGDMRSLPKSIGNFDVCLSMFFSFGFFDDKENMQVLREYRKSLKSGGRLLIHTDVNPDRVEAGTYGDRHRRTLRCRGELFVDEQVLRDTGTLHGSWTIHRDNRPSITESYVVRIYSHREMAIMLMEAGFSNVRTAFSSSSSPDSGAVPQEVLYVATL